MRCCYKFVGFFGECLEIARRALSLKYYSHCPHAVESVIPFIQSPIFNRRTDAYLLVRDDFASEQNLCSTKEPSFMIFAVRASAAEREFLASRHAVQHEKTFRRNNPYCALLSSKGYPFLCSTHASSCTKSSGRTADGM